MKLYRVAFVCLLSVVVFSCKKEEKKTPAQLLEGKWLVSNSNILGSDIPGDGSYLQFAACSSSCSGVDFKASDTTTGVFTYSIDEEGILLTINDNSSDGGSWNATWDVLELEESRLKITGSTFLGNLTVTFTK